MQTRSPKLRHWALCCLLAVTQAAWAISLEEAKQTGLVGETASGYLAVVTPPGDAAVQTLVEDINSKRRSEYARIARSNGIELADVEKLAAQKAIEKTPAGQWIRLGDGLWRRK